MKTMMILAALATLAFAVQSRADAPTASEKMTDAEIAQVLKKANDAEIDQAKVAQTRASDSEVKDFAKHMVKDHTKNNKMAAKVEQRTSIVATSSAASQKLVMATSAKTTDLKKVEGNDFDKSYINNQVAMHSQLLKDLDATYIPQTQNAEMKAFLEQTRMHVQQHLELAEKLQAKLEGPQTNGPVSQ